MSAIAGVFGRRAPEAVSGMLRALGPETIHLAEGDQFTLGQARPFDGVMACHSGTIFTGRPQRALEAPTELEGMFALAMWSDAQQMGVLVRDRVGHKPLYTVRHQGALWFASELKALLRVPDFERKLNLEALHHFLSYGYLPSPMTLLSGISRLLPAHRLTWQDGRVTTQRYWSLNWAPRSHESGVDELAEELLELLRSAVRIRLRARGEVGMLLSGGLDSALLAALATEVGEAPLRTYTLKAPGYQRAALVARHLKARHTELELDPRPFRAQLPELLAQLDEPCATPLPSLAMVRSIGNEVKVVLSGHGADQLLGSTLSHRLAAPLAEMARTGEAPEGVFEADYLSRLVESQDWMWRYKLLLFTDQEKERLYHPARLEDFQGFSTLNHLKRVFAHLTAGDPLNRILEVEFATMLPDQVLNRLDRLSQISVLEVRTPYLDTAVAEFLAGLPARFKMQGSQGKLVLRAAARKVLPASLVDELSLAGFDWQELTPDAVCGLEAEDLSCHGLFLPASLRRLIQALQAGDSRATAQLLALGSFHIWQQLYLDAALAVKA